MCYKKITSPFDNNKPWTGFGWIMNRLYGKKFENSFLFGDDIRALEKNFCPFKRKCYSLLNEKRRNDS